MLGYSKLEWIVSGTLGLALCLWILKPSDPKSSNEAERASTAEIMKCSELIKSSRGVFSVVVHELTGTSSDKKGPGGTSRVNMYFEAKNSFGQEASYKAICQFAEGVPAIQIQAR